MIAGWMVNKMNIFEATVVEKFENGITFPVKVLTGAHVANRCLD